MGPRTNIMNLFTRSCRGTTVGPPWFCSQRPATCAEAVRVETQGLSILRTQEPGRPTGSLALNSEMGPWFGGQAMRPVPSNRPTCAAGRNFRSLRGPPCRDPCPCLARLPHQGKEEKGRGFGKVTWESEATGTPSQAPGSGPWGQRQAWCPQPQNLRSWSCPSPLDLPEPHHPIPQAGHSHRPWALKECPLGKEGHCPWLSPPSRALCPFSQRLVRLHAPVVPGLAGRGAGALVRTGVPRL